MNRFQVGDKVQVASNNYGCDDYRAGQIGIVERIGGSDGQIFCGLGLIGADVRFDHGTFYLCGSEMTDPVDSGESLAVNFDDEWAKIRNLLNPILELVHDRGLVVKYSLRDQEITIKREV